MGGGSSALPPIVRADDLKELSLSDEIETNDAQSDATELQVILENRN